MPRFRGRDLHSRPPYESTRVAITPRLFDLARNWALGEALLSDPEIDLYSMSKSACGKISDGALPLK